MGRLSLNLYKNYKQQLMVYVFPRMRTMKEGKDPKKDHCQDSLIGRGTKNDD